MNLLYTIGTMMENEWQNDQQQAVNARKRRDIIASRIIDHGSVQIADLMEEFGLTDTSIRRDLSILEQMGILFRVRGGGISTGKALQIGTHEKRMDQHRSEKQRIAAAAIMHIQSQDVILMDSGTTILELAHRIPLDLRHSARLRIVTNSIPISDELGIWAGTNLFLLGGVYLSEHRATVGPEMLAQLQKISARRTFLGCDGLTVSDGITSAHPLIAEAGQMMAARAEEVIVLADHSKLGRAGFVPIIPSNKINLLITDEEAPPEVVKGLRDRGIEVILV